MVLKGSSYYYDGPFSVEEDCHTGISIKAMDETYDDDSLSASILTKLLWYSHTPIEEISVSVKYGYVVLSGIVAWEYQKEVMTSMVKNILGVKGVINNINVITVWPKKLTAINKN
ncbi:MAG TPA: BON domain-containing protein [Bacteroidia bacterium]|jgi:osmotically-inducible protein OsmY|nr:BON domain-containing protein [Bacteroidia bacterium]